MITLSFRKHHNRQVPPENSRALQSCRVCVRASAKKMRLLESQPLFQNADSPAAGEKPPALSLQDARGFPEYAGQYGKPLRLLMGTVSLVLLIALTKGVMRLMAAIHRGSGNSA